MRQRLEPPDGAQEYSWFGIEMAIDENTLAIGELGWDDASRDKTEFFGAVSVYARSKNNQWELQQQIKSPRSRSNNDHYFGRGLALQDDTLVVDASRVDVNGHSGAGAVYVYVRVGQRWSLAQTLTAPDAGDRHYFGKRVAIDRDAIVVSAPRWNWDTLARTFNGKVYVYRETSHRVLRAGLSKKSSRRKTTTVSTRTSFTLGTTSRYATTSSSSAPEDTTRTRRTESMSVKYTSTACTAMIPWMALKRIEVGRWTRKATGQPVSPLPTERTTTTSLVTVSRSTVK